MGPNSCKAQGYKIGDAVLNRFCRGLSGENQERAFFQAMEQLRSTCELKFPGLNRTHNAILLVTIELAFRFASKKLSLRPKQPVLKLKIKDLAHEALNRMGPQLRLQSKEWLGFIPFFDQGLVGDWVIAERGVRTHVNIDPSELFSKILTLRPRAVILAHNHPSGNPEPSPADFQLTARVDRLCRELNLLLLGHWVVAPEAEAWIPIESTFQARL